MSRPELGPAFSRPRTASRHSANRGTPRRSRSPICSSSAARSRLSAGPRRSGPRLRRARPGPTIGRPTIALRSPRSSERSRRAAPSPMRSSTHASINGSAPISTPRMGNRSNSPQASSRGSPGGEKRLSRPPLRHTHAPVKRQPLASRSSTVARSPNGSGVTPRIQSSMRATSTSTKTAFRPICLVRKVDVIGRLPAAARLGPVLVQLGPTDQGDIGEVRFMFKQDRDLARSAHVGALYCERPSVRNRICPLVLARIVQHPPHRANAGRAGLAFGREPAIARVSHRLRRAGQKAARHRRCRIWPSFPALDPPLLRPGRSARLAHLDQQV